jgi:hypothetical protein
MRSGTDMGRTTGRSPSSSALRRLQGFQVHSSEGQLLTPLDFESTSKIISLGIQGESLGHMVPRICRLAHNSALARFHFRERQSQEISLHFYHQEMTSADIRKQMRKLKKARKRLAEALKAAWPGRQSEGAANMSGPKTRGKPGEGPAKDRS